MAGPLKSSSSKNNHELLANKRIGIVTAAWNDDITGALKLSCIQSLSKSGVKRENIIIKSVSGTFELSLGAQWLAEQKDIDAVICLGCVIQGETPHFDYICQAVAYGITEVNLKYNKPVIFGVLTTLNKQQALDRAGGKYGNKGEEAALTAVEMLLF
ncbi:MAG TPA: 6,7-dimethyl-8-ribityllumazine synthase [Cyclobacteriaceae bacterium]|nr:6,7-dimethyl-8-ribityllumazine synthase [Cyclobacteriaceae bacterium]